MIQSFRCAETEKIFNRYFSKKLPQAIQRAALKKLEMLHQARTLNDLKVPPNNYLEALGDDRQGQHSIRINQQWRICFRWIHNEAHDVEIVDYH